MTNCKKGKLTELIFTVEAIKREFVVAIPTTDERYDLIIEKNGKLFKIQVKKMHSVQHGKKDRFGTDLVHGKYLQRKGLIKKYGEKYKRNEVDFYALYKEETNSFYIVPFSESLTYFYAGKEENKKSSIYKNAWDLIK
jgi:hypothetical protein